MSSVGAPRQLTLCFSTLGCTELDLEDVLALATRRAIPAVELRGLGGTLDLPAYFEQRYGTPDRLRALVRQSGIRIASLNASGHLIGTRPEERAELLALAPWALATGALRLRLFDGGETGSEGELASAQATLKWWRDLALPLDLMIETHDALARPAALQRFLDALPDVPILWDTFHTWGEGEEDPAVTWNRVRRRTLHLHVKDARAAGPYVAPGAGEYPFDSLLRALRSDGFGGFVSLEWERHWFPELPSIDTALDGFGAVFANELAHTDAVATTARSL